jgi:cytochrome c peroxidase
MALANDINTPNHAKFNKEPIQPIPQYVEFNKSKAKIGESLFFDTRLSSNNSVSCGSCHQLEAGGDDNQALGISLSEQHHTLNTPTIFNAQFNFKQDWNGSANTLNKQIDNVIKSHHEFNTKWETVVSKLTSDSSLTKAFNKQYKNGITKENIIDSLVEFEKTLFTPNSRFDRYLRNEIDLSIEEKQGYALFKSLGCVSCHQGINVGGNVFQKFGVFYNYLAEQGDIKKSDYGRYNITQRKFDKFVFRVPPLRNIAVTAPYLHNGSATTLEDAIRIMGSTQLGRKLNDHSVSLIKSFLNTLTGEYKNNPLGDTL